jgi:hypothetical protein
VRADEHPGPRLAALVNGTLSGAERIAVANHVRACGGCRDELAGWRALSDATRLAARETLAVGAAPRPAPSARVLAEIEKPRPGGRLGHGLAVLRRQVPLVRTQIWPASLLVMSLGFLACLLERAAFAGLVFTLVVPFIASVGVVFIYGPETDPSLELALATPTSPRTILLARLTLVCGFDLALAAIASLGLAALGLAPGGLGHLVSLWLGPMLLLSSGSLLVSLYLGGAAALVAAFGAWTIRTSVAFGTGGPLTSDLMVQLWSTGPLTLGLAAAAFALALVAGVGRERLT